MGGSVGIKGARFFDGVNGVLLRCFVGKFVCVFFPVFSLMGENKKLNCMTGYINRGDTINGLSFVGVKSYINDTEIW